ncbi:tRNA (N6-threonylcarbamoyladenosine(37)-N6)-methyltransferase TrmO [Marinobacter antarcticus]|uniref:tRNA (N6-threonylcarbamoyladenosine(37)-N6)-methyltransferase TrmO n=1 Tax=Marinobacter antarcticus TaxID=564117 RepID=A0A831R5Y9_9GAMM|nr:tRNA (N6-threonylcarbamoyladenosine(37)-N6)-methyltransferase TrmO [Marinobacter antarcticus]HEA52849.1 tRNA (N6-threonylcarbamoyladenosine(37)-N6)-methyltransferase TrmO [Marinobacter antarcticus]
MPRHDSKPASDALALTPIAITRSCFNDKFGVPRQPGLTRYARADLIIQPPYNREDAFRGLDTASHLWLIFQFHEAVRAEWRPVVRPPRLGGNQKMGVFASRSPFRPNSLGLSVVRNEGLVQKGDHLALQISDHDLIDGTPILDIKPYLPFADSVPDAGLGWADTAPTERLEVVFLPEAEAQLAVLSPEHYPDLKLLITDIVSYDPRPSFRRGRDEARIYGAHLYDLNVRFRFVNDHSQKRVEVLTVC